MYLHSDAHISLIQEYSTCYLVCSTKHDTHSLTHRKVLITSIHMASNSGIHLDTHKHAFQHSNITLTYSDMYKSICSPSWTVLLTRADTDTFTHINILRSHSHENYHTFTHCIHDQKFTHTHEVSVPTMTHSFTHAGQHWHKEEHAQVFICTQTVKLTRKLTNSVT